MARPSNLNWILDLVSLVQGAVVTVPTNYREQVLAVKKLLENDETGLVSSLLDFGISSSADVDFSVEVNNAALSKILNDWLADINGMLLGKIPIGIEALAKEYYRERWKGSSMLVLRTLWNTVDGMRLPVKMWFVDGEDVEVSSNSEVVALGEQKYSLITNYQEKKLIALPTGENEKIFVQKPYCSWGVDYPVPFVIQRGLYKNAMLMKNLINKGEVVVAKALEYLLLVKKGTEVLAKENRNEFIYSDEDLKAVKEQLGDLSKNRNSEAGVPSYITNFDTEIEHLIPDYERILKPALFVPIERRILSGIGLVDIVESSSSSRREGTLNPKPFIGELNSGVQDFAALLKDIILTIIIENKASHPKYFSDKQSLAIRNTPVKAFMTDEYKTMLRSLYDRGVLSKQTFVEVVGETCYNEERDRREQEEERGDNETFYPPVIQNMEQYLDAKDGEEPKKVDVDEKKVTPDKTGPEAKNYTNSTKELPAVVLELPVRGQTIWKGIYNDNEDCSDEVERQNIAWTGVKNVYKQNEQGSWSLKTKAEVIETFKGFTMAQLLEMKKLELASKQEKVLDALIKESEEGVDETSR
jgi:cation transport regulator ChaB